MTLYTQNLYQKQQIEQYIWNLTFANKDHPIFKAHFDFMPLLPAFLQIDIASELANLHIIGIKQAKFISPIKPDEQVQYILVAKNSSDWTLKIKDQTQLKSQIQFTVS